MIRLVRGGETVPPAEPETDADTIAALEGLLAKARAGEIVGLAYVVLLPSLVGVGMGYSAGCNRSNVTVLGGIGCLQGQMIATLE